MKHWSDKLPKDACRPAVEWCRTQPSAQAAWKACGNHRWMLWLIFRVAGKFGAASHRRACRVLAACVRPALKHVPKNEKRPAAAIRLIEKYARGGRVTREELRNAANAAYAAAHAAHAAYAAADAAYAAAAYADAIAYTSHAAAQVASAVQSKIIRRLMPAPPRLR